MKQRKGKGKRGLFGIERGAYEEGRGECDGGEVKRERDRKNSEEHTH